MPDDIEAVAPPTGNAVAHYIITRFGIGQKSPQYYSANFPLLRFVLAESLRQQTSKDFKWILIIDENCPNWVRDGISALQQEIRNLDIVVHDPWSHLTMMPDLFLILQSRAVMGQAILTSRVDHDDALSLRFNEVVCRSVRQRISSHQSADCAIYYPRGVAYFVSSKRALRLEKKDYSVVSMLSTFGPIFRDCYSENHTGFFQTRPGRGVLSIDIGEPLWMRVVRPDSSHKAGGQVATTKVADRFPVLRIPHSMLRRALDRKYSSLYIWPIGGRGLMRNFGVPPTALAKLGAGEPVRLDSAQREVLEMVDVNPSRFMQFSAKSAILDFWKAHEQGSEASPLSKDELKQVFYSI